MIQVKITSSVTEPITASELKTFLGFPASDTSQDVQMGYLITSAREFIEKFTGRSLVAKTYDVYFEKEDMRDGWFEIPVSPVNVDAGITLAINGQSCSFEGKGIDTYFIRPLMVVSTIPAGSAPLWYAVVSFTSGAVTSGVVKTLLLRLAGQLFNNKEDGIEISVSRLPVDTMKMLNQLSRNV